MIRRLLATALLLYSLCDAKVSKYRDEDEYSAENDDEGTIWAVLVAGSNGWYNYRHQADICHAYHLLITHGVAPEHIITLMFDDVANNEDNPFPGQLFNSPTGKDVYKGVKIDYTGDSVNPKNFIAILEGDKKAVRGGNGRVLESTKKDKVFIYFADHGATGLIAFPDGVLTVKQLATTLTKMSQDQKYAELTFYLEACESGSMFENLDPSLKIYAITASNAHESSWGCYCDNDKGLPCLGDLFSVNWMQDSDKENLGTETLDEQFQIVKRLTNKSHVMHYGDLDISREHVAEFQGEENAPRNRRPEIPPSQSVNWPARDIPLLMLRQQWEQENDEQLKTEIERKVRHMHKKRDYLDNWVEELVNSIIHDPNNRNRVLTTYPRTLKKLDCHDDVVNAFHRVCFDFNENPYALKYVYVLANLCEMGLETELLVQKLLDICPDIDVKRVH